jgi:hypothetical protein
MKSIWLSVFFLCATSIVSGQVSGVIGGSNGAVGRFPGPQVYQDPASGTTLYVESDGRHVVAISKEGKLLWVRDIFKDAKLEFYRTYTPPRLSG